MPVFPSWFRHPWLGFVAFILFAFPHPSRAQQPTVEWDRTLGGALHDVPYSLHPTADGGYILGCVSHSLVSADKTQPPRGVDDYWVVKVDAQGRRQWDRTLGGSAGSLSYLRQVQPTPDGGYIVGGYSNSGIGGDRTQPSRGNYDYWLLKLDAQGNKLWDQAYGGPSVEYFESLCQTTDGGYLLGGYSGSGVGGEKSQPGRGSTDYWVVKVDAQGNKQWDRTFGGSPTDPFHSSQLMQVRQTPDGGYALAGISSGQVGGEKSQACRGRSDYWLLKLDARGNQLWDRTVGGTDSDLLRDLQVTADGGFLLAGESFSGATGEKTQPSQGSSDYWVVKLDAAGNQQWDRTYGGSEQDLLQTVRATPEGGYVLGGASRSGRSGDKSQPSQGATDAWLVKLDEQGQKEWDQTYGGPEADGIYCLQPTPDGWYVLGAYSLSGTSPGKRSPGLGLTDVWLLKLGPPAVHITGTAALCASSEGQLTAVPTDVAATFRWSTGATTPSIRIDQPGTYAVTATFARGLTSTANYQVTSALATVRIQGDSVLCPDQPLTLTAVGAESGASYRWNTGSTAASITVREPGLYAVRLTTAAGCSAQAQLRVQAPPALAEFTLGADTTVCQGQEIVLQAPATHRLAGLSYAWSTGATTAAVRVREPGTYSLRIRSGCTTRTASRTVRFAPCLRIPNIITPNDDHLNDTFVVQGLVGNTWTLELYNQWGQQVYASAAYQNDWGAAAAVGTYYYLLRQAGTSQSYKGWLEVSR